MIALDTHIWIWWVQNDPRLTSHQRQHIRQHEDSGLGVSVICCWEVCKLVERRKLAFALPVGEWLTYALSYPGVQLLEFTPGIALESTQLPGDFHRDPADQIIVATARVLDCALITADRHILNYPHVRTVGPDSA